MRAPGNPAFNSRNGLRACVDFCGLKKKKKILWFFFVPSPPPFFLLFDPALMSSSCNYVGDPNQVRER